MIAPDERPFANEPRREAQLARIELPLQLLQPDPAPGRDFITIGAHPLGAVAVKHRTELVLGAGRIELRLILKLEQKPQRAAEPELLTQPPLRGGGYTLTTARMATAAV